MLEELFVDKLLHLHLQNTSCLQTRTGETSEVVPKLLSLATRLAAKSEATVWHFRPLHCRELWTKVDRLVLIPIVLLGIMDPWVPAHGN